MENNEILLEAFNAMTKINPEMKIAHPECDFVIENFVDEVIKRKKDIEVQIIAETFYFFKLQYKLKRLNLHEFTMGLFNFGFFNPLGEGASEGFEKLWKHWKDYLFYNHFSDTWNKSFFDKTIEEYVCNH